MGLIASNVLEIVLSSLFFVISPGRLAKPNGLPNRFKDSDAPIRPSEAVRNMRNSRAKLRSWIISRLSMASTMIGVRASSEAFSLPAFLANPMALAMLGLFDGQGTSLAPAGRNYVSPRSHSD